MKMLTNSKTLEFINKPYLDAMYKEGWLRYEKREYDYYFVHCPILNRIRNSAYFYAANWRSYREPVFHGDADFLGRTLEEYSLFCKRNNIVCELIRLEARGNIQALITLNRDRKIVHGQPVAILEMPACYEDYFKKIPNRTRRNISIAERELSYKTLNVYNNTYIKQMYELYTITLNRVNANLKWHLTIDDFFTLSTLEFFTFIIIYDIENKISSFAGLYNDGEMLNVLMIGNHATKNAIYSCDLLYASIVKHAYQLDPVVRFIHFGGGRTHDPSDSLLKFKSKFTLGVTTPCDYLVLSHGIPISTSLAPKNHDRFYEEPFLKRLRDIFPFL